MRALLQSDLIFPTAVKKYHAEWNSTESVYFLYDPDGVFICSLHVDPETLLSHLNRQQIANEAWASGEKID